MSTYRGIDYGLGQTNIDADSGIRYGVIPVNDVLQAWADSAESDYGDPTCGHCGNPAVEVAGAAVADIVEGFDESEHSPDCAIHAERGADCDCECADLDSSKWTHERYECAEYFCPGCRRVFGSESAFADEPIADHYNDDGIRAESSGDRTDIFVMASPYYTRAPFCSPCAPGACYLRDGRADDSPPRAYCFPSDWFDDGECPYPVYRVSDDVLIYSPTARK